MPTAVRAEGRGQNTMRKLPARAASNDSNGYPRCFGIRCLGTSSRHALSARSAGHPGSFGAVPGPQSTQIWTPGGSEHRNERIGENFFFPGFVLRVFEAAWPRHGPPPWAPFSNFSCISSLADLPDSGLLEQRAVLVASVPLDASVQGACGSATDEIDPPRMKFIRCG